MVQIPFLKMHGIGNDFVMVDCLDATSPVAGLSEASLAELAIKVNDRRFGIGGDGLILVERGESAPFRMRMFNPDGSESEMCGNGIRCFARLLHDRGHTQEASVDVETGAGTLTVTLVGEDSVRVDMGIGKISRAEIGMVPGLPDPFIDAPLDDTVWHGTAVSMGNPHVVIFTSDVDTIKLEEIGPRIEHHPLFPARVNVHFVQVISRTHLKMRTWERGAGITLACGTGACSVGVASLLNGHSEAQVRIDLPGGSLHIEVQEDRRVMMTGPAKTVFEGVYTFE